jgi:hypothetical protein
MGRVQFPPLHPSEQHHELAPTKITTKITGKIVKETDR